MCLSNCENGLDAETGATGEFITFGDRRLVSAICRLSAYHGLSNGPITGRAQGQRDAVIVSNAAHSPPPPPVSADFARHG